MMEQPHSQGQFDMSALSATTLRVAGEEDREFLLSVYADSRRDEMAKASGWTEAQKQSFLQTQFDAQDTYYREHYPEHEFYVICHLGLDVGRLYLERKIGAICIMDIAVLHEHRRKGIGRFLVQQILAEARELDKSVILHVEPDNPAKQLYLSEGFNVTGEISFYQKMEWHPDSG